MQLKRSSHTHGTEKDSTHELTLLLSVEWPLNGLYDITTIKIKAAGGEEAKQRMIMMMQRTTELRRAASSHVTTVVDRDLPK